MERKFIWVRDAIIAILVIICIILVAILKDTDHLLQINREWNSQLWAWNKSLSTEVNRLQDLLNNKPVNYPKLIIPK